ncbi:MAG: hypothetical protein U5K77_00400 [Candidatus Saccharibacteria bacterium]|nr:hypothetical protein [Candidatus Saccharibacteria bacterium]
MEFVDNIIRLDKDDIRALELDPKDPEYGADAAFDLLLPAAFEKRAQLEGLLSQRQFAWNDGEEGALNLKSSESAQLEIISQLEEDLIQVTVGLGMTSIKETLELESSL